VHSLSRIDPWFLAQIEDIVREEQAVQSQGLEAFDRDRVRALKRKGSPTDVSRRCSAWTRTACAAVASRWASAGLQARRHLRRRVRHLDGLHVLDVRRGVRGRRRRIARRS
jgi:hypothetical protein